MFIIIKIGKIINIKNDKMISLDQRPLSKYVALALK